MTTDHYSLGKPTELDLIAALERLMGCQQASVVMGDARAFCGTNNPGDPLLGLTKIAVWLSKQKGLASVVGQSMTIRIKFYNSIYRTHDYART